MNLDISTQEGLTLVRIEGNLDGATAPQVQEKILPLVKAGVRMVVDLGECRFVSSAGLRVLLLFAKRIVAADGKWALVGLSAEVQDVMEMTGFSQHFPIFPGVEEARKAVRNASEEKHGTN